MTIKEYYDNYNLNGKYDILLPTSETPDATIQDFYNNCIEKSISNDWFKNALKWHEMLMEYVEMPEAIYWIRYYENCKDEKAKVFRNRRACFTKFNDGFSYVFISNYDVHEIFNMVTKGIVPTAKEFLEMMKNFEYPLHYQKDLPKKDGWPCEETEIVAYKNNIGRVNSGVLTNQRWYLAHIFDVKGVYKRKSGVFACLTKTEREKIYPHGVKNDWKNTNHIREIEYSLVEEEEEFVKAHFLRFVDPLNYFLVPCERNQTHTCKAHFSAKGKPKQIGEYVELTKYMVFKYKSIFGKVYDEYLNKILVDSSFLEDESNFAEAGAKSINIEYGPKKFFTKLETNCDDEESRKYDEKIELKLLKDFLFDGLSLKKLEEKHLGGAKDGWAAMSIRNSYGIESKQKGLFKDMSLDEAIAKSSGTLKEILEKMKEVLV